MSQQLLEKIVDRLKADAGVSAIAGDRVYPDSIPQGESLPAVVYSQQGRTGLPSFEGPIGLDEYTMLFDCVARTRLEASQLSSAVLAAMDGWTDAVDNVRGTFLDGETAVYDAPSDASDLGHYRFTSTYRIWSQRT